MRVDVPSPTGILPPIMSRYRPPTTPGSKFITPAGHERLQAELEALWKVERLLRHLNKRCRDMWIPGKWVAIDEQTLGFQGASG